MSAALRFPIGSPVNYEAWENGYLPPSEHILIHKLMFEGLKVEMSNETPHGGFWLVTKGNPFGGASHDLQMHMLQTWIDEIKIKKEGVKAAFQFLIACTHTARISENTGTTPPVDSGSEH